MTSGGASLFPRQRPSAASGPPEDGWRPQRRPLPRPLGPQGPARGLSVARLEREVAGDDVPRRDAVDRVGDA